MGLSTAREGATLFYTDVVPVADFNAIHAVDRYWLIAEELGAGAGRKTFHVPVPEAERAWARELLRGKPRPYVALAPGSRWVTKRWPPEHFRELLRRIEKASRVAPKPFSFNQADCRGAQFAIRSNASQPRSLRCLE